MRVKISYGAELEEVPKELDQLFSYISERVEYVKVQTEYIEDALAEEEIDIALPLIDKMRRTLGSMDQRLSDIEMIGKGYLDYKKGDEDVHEGRSTVDSVTGNTAEGTTKQPRVFSNNE